MVNGVESDSLMIIAVTKVIILIHGQSYSDKLNMQKYDIMGLIG